jgi:hypothetical protein
VSTLLEIRDRVRLLTGIESAAVLPDARIDAFIREAHNTWHNAADWSYMIETDVSVVAAGSDTFVIGSLSGPAYRVVDGWARQVGSEKPYELFERAAPFISEDDDGLSREFAWDAAANTMRVWPAPSKDTEFTFRFVVDRAPLTLDTDVSEVPERFIHGIEYMAAARILEVEADQSDRPEIYEARAGQALLEARRVLLTSARKTVQLGSRREFRRGIRRGVY